MQAKYSIAIFKGKVKDRRHRYQGVVTRDGRKALEARRLQLATLVGRPASRVSDGDLIEYLARGEDATRAYLSQ